MEQRKAFNFYRSYFDVFNELESDKDKIVFITALLEKQFYGVDPVNLTGNAKFAWISQQHSINTQVKGWEDKTGKKLNPSLPPSVGGLKGGIEPPYLQEQEQEQVKEKEQVKVEVKEYNNNILGKFYNENKKEIELIRDVMNCSLEDAISYRKQELEELTSNGI